MCDEKQIPLKSYHIKLNEELLDVTIKLLKLQIEFLKLNKMDYASFITFTEKKVAFIQSMSKATNSCELKQLIASVLKEYEAVLRD